MHRRAVESSPRPRQEGGCQAERTGHDFSGPAHVAPNPQFHIFHLPFSLFHFPFSAPASRCRISNRHSRLLETSLTPTKQTTPPPSNRHTIKPSRNYVHVTEQPRRASISNSNFPFPALSNRHFPARLKTSLASTKQSFAHLSNRHFWNPIPSNSGVESSSQS
jgi:hypothetical protein